MSTTQTVNGITFRLVPRDGTTQSYWSASYGPPARPVYGTVDDNVSEPYYLYDWFAANYRAHRFPRGCERTLAAALAQCAQTMLEIRHARRI